MTNPDISVVVSSCDAYSDVWAPFFECLFNYWPDLTYEIVLVAESKQYTGKHPVRTFNPSEKSASWTRRLREALESVQSKYVLFLLEDFFFEQNINTAEINRLARVMDKDDAITYFSFVLLGEPSVSLPGPLENSYMKPPDSLYRLNAMPALWRRERFIDFLQIDADAWRWESTGNLRSFNAPDKFCFFNLDYKRPIPWIHGITGQKWIPEIEELSKKQGLGIDFSKRGFYNDSEWALQNCLLSFLIVDPYVRLGNEEDVFFDKGKKHFGSSKVITSEGPFDQRILISEPLAKLESKAAKRRRADLDEDDEPAQPALYASWTPTEKSRGFYIDDFKIEVECLSGDVKDVTDIALVKNDSFFDQKLVILGHSCRVIFPLPQDAVAIRAHGNILCPLDADVLRIEQEKQQLIDDYNQAFYTQRVEQQVASGEIKTTGMRPIDELPLDRRLLFFFPQRNTAGFDPRLYYSFDTRFAETKKRTLPKTGNRPVINQYFSLPQNSYYIKWHPKSGFLLSGLEDLTIRFYLSGGHVIKLRGKDYIGNCRKLPRSALLFFSGHDPYVIAALPYEYDDIIGVRFRAGFAESCDLKTVSRLAKAPVQKHFPFFMRIHRIIARYRRLQINRKADPVKTQRDASVITVPVSPTRRVGQ